MDEKILNFYTDEKLQDIKNLQYANSQLTNHILELESEMKQLKKELMEVKNGK